MAPTSREKKASRITTACNPCRSRKQKCSGERPTCEQCLEYSRPCAWPEQLKRGPAKGYIETLEHRLHETETLLLRLLSHISDEQLSSILSEQKSPSTSNLTANSNSNSTPNSIVAISTPLSRKSGGEYWKRFPLTSSENIRRWERDYSTFVRGSSTNTSVGNGAGDGEIRIDPTLSTSVDDNHSRTATTSAEDVVGEDMLMSSELSPTIRAPVPHSDAFDDESGTIFPRGSNVPETPIPSGQHYPENQDRSYTTVPQNSGGMGLPSSVPNTPDLVQPLTPVVSEPSSWIAAPPMKFQRQFLW